MVDRSDLLGDPGPGARLGGIDPPGHRYHGMVMRETPLARLPLHKGTSLGETMITNRFIRGRPGDNPGVGLERGGNIGDIGLLLPYPLHPPLHPPPLIRTDGGGRSRREVTLRETPR